MPKILVVGKQVVLVDRLPAKQFHGLLKALREWDKFGWGDRPPEEEMGPYVGTVQSWEFGGDPHQLESWLNLDTFSEWPPLCKAINTYLSESFNAAMAPAKNSTETPISP